MKRKHAQAHTYAEKQNNSLHIVVIKTKKKKKKCIWYMLPTY